MCRRLPTALLIAATMASSAHGATEDLLVYNELEQNGFSHLSSQYSAGQVNYASLVLPHTGLYSVRADNHPASVAVASWAAPAAYSTLSDYDGISFWIFGPDGSEAIDLVLYSGDDLVGYASVADMYGAPIPAATWIHLQLSFSSNLFNPSGLNATTFTDIAFRFHSAGDGSFLLDDIVLTGADIFKNDFENP